MTYRLVADESTLVEVAPRLQSESRVALDCEAAGFHRYTDRLCLVQLSTPAETFLFDPLAMDPSAVLRPLLEDSAVQVVMHGADFDLRLLHRDLDIKIQGLFDTQIAATLLGAPAVGLASLLKEYLGVKLSKEHQRADWAQRPLAPELLEYAADDTRHLLPLAEVLATNLEAASRQGWAKEEFTALEGTEWKEDLSDPVTRFKAARHLTPRQVTALRAALSWRDKIAQARDRAPFRVVGDSPLMAIVMEGIDSVERLAALSGMSPRLARSRGPELLAELERIGGLPENQLQPYPRGNRNGPGRLTPEEEAKAEAVRSLRTARAKELELDKGVLLSNAQIVEIVRAGPKTLQALKALSGIRRWQAEILGPEILRLLH